MWAFLQVSLQFDICFLSNPANEKLIARIACNGQGFMLCWYSLNVQPGTAADLKN
jgi:hypothetical protein